MSPVLVSSPLPLAVSIISRGLTGLEPAHAFPGTTPRMPSPHVSPDLLLPLVPSAQWTVNSVQLREPGVERKAWAYWGFSLEALGVRTGVQEGSLFSDGLAP